MKKITFLLSFFSAAGLFVGSPAANALVAPGSTFSFDLIGGNTNGGAFYLAGPATATFGLTSTTTGPDNQVITISSSEAVGATTTTDTFTLTTPTNFLNEAAITGTTINALQFDIGDVNSGAAVPVVTPIGMYTSMGTFTDGSGATLSTSSIPGSGVNTMVATDGLSYGAAEGVNTGDPATPINAYDVHGFTYSITYNTLPATPEPSTWATLGVGLVASVIVIRRKLKTSATC